MNKIHSNFVVLESIYKLVYFYINLSNLPVAFSILYEMIGLFSFQFSFLLINFVFINFFRISDKHKR